MAYPNHAPVSTPTKAAPSTFVEVTIVFRDLLKKPIEGLAVLVKAGSGVPPAPEWELGKYTDDPSAGNPASAAGIVSATAPDSSPTMVSNSTEVVTDADGYALTIRNAARSQPISVWVKNRRGKYVWKADVTPKKDISAFTINSPEYHLEATTMLTPKDEFEQELDLPVVKEGEVMTIERLVKELGRYIGWSQKVTEQGKVRKDFPTHKKEVTENEKTHKKTTKNKIDHHYKVVNTGAPRTIVLNILGSRLNYPKPETFSEKQYSYIATQLDVEVAAIKAIVKQESHGHPFLENGLPPILYERRHFFKLAVAKQTAIEKKANISKKDIQTPSKQNAPPRNPYPAHPDLCFAGPDDYGKGGLNQYDKLVRAAALDFEIALKSCSWGGFQILGEYYSGCDCATVFEFANKFMSGTDGQASIFVSFMKNMKMSAVAGLKSRDWEKVATGYNGSGWRTHNPDYANNLRKFYEEFN
ncbi:N-acetylmuramidase family protein [Burkholderia vietnamiensis]|uniref:N-acetylmuramidase family protein n=1 Tax=Burkholderia vietnamiensis TaxID=60552 RepID=UPI0018C88315|nr:N-acetylmuramidase family protein [Burkholderia vietnamiensis]